MPSRPALRTWAYSETFKGSSGRYALSVPPDIDPQVPSIALRKGPEEYLSEEEEPAFAELNRLAEELKEIDPAAFNGYEGFLWPGLLDRWLY
ncbi:hypothetical protein [Streptomyces hydrogenans]|uniref:hypothetical protein n=1 Tax=Streptomyces hydrogenans TaxID=1873719 RepID=UPI0035E24D01